MYLIYTSPHLYKIYTSPLNWSHSFFFKLYNDENAVRLGTSFFSLPFAIRAEDAQLIERRDFLASSWSEKWEKSNFKDKFVEVAGLNGQPLVINSEGKIELIKRGSKLDFFHNCAFLSLIAVMDIFIACLLHSLSISPVSTLSKRTIPMTSGIIYFWSGNSREQLKFI